MPIPSVKMQDENQRLKKMIRQMHAMARMGCDRPNTAYRWCERIDEVAIHGPVDEYAAYEGKS